MKSELKSQGCPLCAAPDADEFHTDQRRDYFQCRTCFLVFVPPQQYLSKDEERAQYDSHENSPEDLEYRKFLSRLYNPLEKQLSRKSCGLDFGSGPGPTLSVMFGEMGHQMNLYDYFYAPDVSVFDQQYDFITTSETVEHLHNPKFEFNRLWHCLRPGGYLGLMTKLVIDKQAFASWHYKNELSHVCFFSKPTFQWLAEQWQANLVFADKDVMIFSKQ